MQFGNAPALAAFRRQFEQRQALGPTALQLAQGLHTRPVGEFTPPQDVITLLRSDASRASLPKAGQIHFSKVARHAECVARNEGACQAMLECP